MVTGRTLLAFVVLLIAYGSLFPFTFAPPPDAAAELVAFVTDLRLPPFPDVAGNVLLFLPLGAIVGLGAMNGNRESPDVARTGMLGFAFALSLQVAQIWLPNRTPSLGDAAINLAGLALGLLVARLGVIRFPLMRWDDRMLVPIALLLSGIAYRWFPWAPTLDPQNIKNGLKPLLIEPSLQPVAVVQDALAWMVWFRILADLPLRSSHAGRALVALGVVVLQPLFVGNSIRLDDLAGLASGALFARWAVNTRSAGAALVLLVVNGLAPFSFNGTASFHWIPLSGFLNGHVTTSLAVASEKFFMYGAAIHMLQQAGCRLGVAAAVVTTLLTLIELLQMWIPGHTAELTDPLLACGLAFAMHRVSSRHCQVEAAAGSVGR